MCTSFAQVPLPAIDHVARDPRRDGWRLSFERPRFGRNGDALLRGADCEHGIDARGTIGFEQNTALVALLESGGGDAEIVGADSSDANRKTPELLHLESSRSP